jgi:hypothetical protein
MARRQQFMVGILIITMLFTAAGCHTAIDSVPEFSLRARMVVGNELRLVVETSRSSEGPFDHHSTTTDVKGYLILIDLDSHKPMKQRSRMFGPLWDVPEPRSSLSFDAGVMFTQQDVDAAHLTPRCAFDSNGTLLRFRWDSASKATLRESLEIGSTGASWKYCGDVKPIKNDLLPGSQDELTSTSGQFALIYQDGEAKLYDLFTSLPKEDSWLTTSFVQLRAIKDQGDVFMFLTDDLNCVVVGPMSTNKSKTFDFGGKTYQRADVVTVLHRPVGAPELFPQMFNGPYGAFSIKNELYLFKSDWHSLRLYKPDGTKEFRVATAGIPAWESISYPQMQCQPSTNEIFLFSSNDPTVGVSLYEHLLVTRCNYGNNTVTNDDVPIIDLFDQTAFGDFAPKSAMRVPQS